MVRRLANLGRNFDKSRRNHDGPRMRACLRPEGRRHGREPIAGLPRFPGPCGRQRARHRIQSPNGNPSMDARGVHDARHGVRASTPRPLFDANPRQRRRPAPGDGSTGGIRAATATDQGKASIDWTLITLRVRQRASRYSSPRMTTCLDLQPCKSRAGSSETRNARVPSSFRRLSSW